MVTWQRDIDEIRRLLLEIEGGREAFCALPRSAAEAMMLPAEDCLPDAEARKLAYHLSLLESAGFAKFSRLSNGYWHVRGLTWSGHELLDNIRREDIWAAVRERHRQLGGFSMEILSGLAGEMMRSEAGRLEASDA
ncbi:DUF2513 domain-containing protein [Leisingera daeponensis]|uniref:DUF2513 domain-containing protein n=1 Tax=Leisingera daeponensis TaxID=405746 RepID=UPI001C972813|nr:DUF2513 domain-containing protein [Leisingera daeponensis]MBY6056609.1 DUF2513 domain-containing protein [Leisingera daeponensis]